MARKLKYQWTIKAWFILGFLLSACQGTPVDQDAGRELSPTAVRGVLATVSTPLQPTPAAPTTTGSTIQPPPTAIIMTPTPWPIGDQVLDPTSTPALFFSNLRFATGSDRDPQTIFPAGTIEIFAIWDFAGLSPTDNVRRIWFRDDQIWHVREVYWDIDRYSSTGTVRDLSIYDNEGDGLSPATYRLQLYVNDRLQQEASFVIQEP